MFEIIPAKKVTKCDHCGEVVSELESKSDFDTRFSDESKLIRVSLPVQPQCEPKVYEVCSRCCLIHLAASEEFIIEYQQAICGGEPK